MYTPPPEIFSTLCDFRSYSPAPLSADNIKWFKYAARCQTATLLYNEFNEPKGYVVWAEISRESLNLLWKTNQFPRYIYEWQEGKIRLILDVSIDPGERESMLKALRTLLRSWKVVAFKRRELRLYVRSNTRFKRLF